MTLTQSIITIAAVVLGTVLTRFLPFIIFPSTKEPPKFIKYLANVLPCAAIGLLVIYSIKDAVFTEYFGMVEIVAILLIIILHKWKKNTLLSIAGGTVFYMLLVQYIV